MKLINESVDLSILGSINQNENQEFLYILHRYVVWNIVAKCLFFKAHGNRIVKRRSLIGFLGNSYRSLLSSFPISALFFVSKVHTFFNLEFFITKIFCFRNSVGFFYFNKSTVGIHEKVNDRKPKFSMNRRCTANRDGRNPKYKWFMFVRKHVLQD